MSDGNIIRLRIWPKTQGKYQLHVHVPGDVDVLEAELPISPTTLQARLLTIRSSLNKITRHCGRDVTLTPAKRDDILSTFAQEGYDAFADWVGVRSAAADAISWVMDRYPDANTINILSEHFSLPWEIIATDPLHPSLWGFSYIIQRQLPRNNVPCTPRTQRIETNTPPKVGLLALQDAFHLPAIVHTEIPFFMDLNKKELILCTLMDSLNPRGDKRKELKRLRDFASVDRHIYHFACHVEIDPNPARSNVIITDWFRVSPDDMRRHRIEFKKSPLVVLNACDTGRGNPFHTSDLVSNLLNSEIQGIVATECQVPDVFASAFIQKLYQHLLAGDEIGFALKSCRKYFLEQHNNPLGLLYSLYQISPRWRIIRQKLPTQ
jgi:hypothetical protein